MPSPTAIDSKAKSPDKDDASAGRQKHQIISTLKGPVAARMRQLIPTLAPLDDPYRTVMESPELLYGCLLVFRKQRSKFADFLVDEQGRPVTDDAKPLSCGRSVNDIIGMIVRSGARQYATKRFVDATAKPNVVEPQTKSLLEKLASLVTGNWREDERPKPRPNRNYAEEFYQAIRDNLEHDWQGPLIPHYAELPAKLTRELGPGLTTLRNPEGIAALANIGRRSIDGARKILSDDMMREMLETQPLAAQGVAFLGKANYEALHSAVYGRMGAKFWEMCKDTDRLEALEEKNARDLGEMASYLHIVSADTIHRMTEKLQPYQLSVFLDTAWHALGETEFVAVFGIPGKPGLIRRFAEKAAAFKLDHADPTADFANRLPDIFKAYLLSPKGYEKGL